MTGEARTAGWPPVLLVTGTDTGVGKTVVTAALAAVLSRGPGRGPAVDKPAQTGIGAPAGGDDGRSAVGGDEADTDVVTRLSGVGAVSEGVRLRAPMAPVAAARREGTALPSGEQHLERLSDLSRRHDHLLVEGSGGVLVALADDGTTLPDLGTALAGRLGAGRVGAVVVCRAGLGTLNHTALTVEALERRQVPVTGVVIGSWPAVPDEVDLDNRRHLARGHVPLLGAVPAGAGRLPGPRFRRAAPGWFRTPPAGR